MPLDPKLIAILACPVDKAPVAYRKAKTQAYLTCSQCRRRYPIKNGIPHLLSTNLALSP